MRTLSRPAIARTRWASLITCVLLLTLFAASPPAIAGTLIGSSFSPNNLYELNPADGTATLIGPSGAPTGTALAYDRDSGTIWGTENTSTRDLYTVDLLTGAWTSIATIDVDLGVNVGLAYDPAGDTLFSMGRNDDTLYSIDPVTAVATAIGIAGVDINGLAYDPNNDILYGSSPITDSLYTIDVGTGAAVLVGLVGFDIGGTGLAYDWEDDILYMSVTVTDSLYTLDVGTGSATLVGASGAANINGLTYIPEPSTFLQAALGLLALGYQGRRRRRRC